MIWFLWIATLLLALQSISFNARLKAIEELLRRQGKPQEPNPYAKP